MTEPRARVWKKIACFYALTMLFSGAFDAFVLYAGRMDAGNLLATPARPSGLGSAASPSA